MDNVNLQPYLQLTQSLLDCPKGEEWNLLQQNEELITPELLEVMHHMATQLAAEGQSNAARFLQQWKNQLTHLLEVSPHSPSNSQQLRTQAYLHLIQELLEAPKGAEAEILTKHQDLLDPALVQIMQQVSAQLATKGNQDVAIYLRHLAADLSRMLQGAEQGAQLHSPEPGSPIPRSSKLDTQSDIWQSPGREESRPRSPSSMAAPVQEISLQPQPPILNDEANDEVIVAIAQSLVNLEAMISHRLPANPLWYMEILERAYECAWVLSSDQVKYLIGCEPICSKGQDAFHHDGWRFIKVLPTSSHIGWRVDKEIINLPPVARAVKVAGNTKSAQEPVIQAHL